MGDGGEQQDDAGPVPAHNVTLSALLPDVPSSTSATTGTAGGEPIEPCMFFDCGPVLKGNVSSSGCGNVLREEKYQLRLCLFLVKLLQPSARQSLRIVNQRTKLSESK